MEPTTDPMDDRALERAALARDEQLQTIINDLVRRGRHRSHDEATQALVEAIAGAGLAPMPEPWVDAVADAVARGNPYVVSAHTARVTDVPTPDDDVPSTSVE
jgi:hypothetical protein